MVKLDQWLLRQFQRFSDWATDWLGWNCFELARRNAWAIAFTVLMVIMGFWLEGTEMIGALWVIQLVVARGVHARANIAEREMQDGLRNHREITLAPTRIMWTITTAAMLVLLMPMGSIELLVQQKPMRAIVSIGMCAYFVLIWADEYLVSCTPRPPKQSKVAKWLERWLPAPSHN